MGSDFGGAGSARGPDAFAVVYAVGEHSLEIGAWDICVVGSNGACSFMKRTCFGPMQWGMIP